MTDQSEETRKAREDWFDTVIVPKLRGLAKLCGGVNGMAFIAVVEVAPGKRKQITYFPMDHSASQGMVELDAQVRRACENR